MTTTPTVWKGRHDLNPAELFGDAQQRFASIADIGLGRYVSVYAENGHYRGQIFDAEGGRVNNTFQIDFVEATPAAETFPVALATRPGGGFVAVHVARDGNGGNDGVFFEVYGADGSYLDNGTIQALDTETLTGPSIAMRTDGSFLVTFVRENDDNTFDVVGRRVDVNGQVSSELVIHDSGDTSETFAEAATLTNGNYVVVYQNQVGVGDNDIDFKIFSGTGAPPAGQGFQATPLSFDDDTDPQVAALTGGGFVVAWQDSNDGNGSGIMARIYTFDGLGNPQSGGILPVNTKTTGNQIAPDVIALKDGGFVVVWDDDGVGIKGQRFDASGNKVGDEFVGSPGASLISDTAAKDHPAAALLGDGRFIVGFDTFVDGVLEDVLDVEAAIFDPREKTINGDGNANVITSRLDGATVNGLGGTDTLLGQGAADTLDGGTGADTMKGRAGGDTYVVDNAGDVADETGGSGTDLVRSSRDFSLSDTVHAKGTIENLTLTGTAAKGTGNGGINKIVGNGSANQLFGLGSDDTLEGSGGNDSLDGGTGADTMRGGAQDDTYVVDSASDKVIESGGQGIDTIRSSVAFTLGANVERLTLTGTGAVDGTGNTLANVIIGNGAANRINGGIGLDTLTGGLGPDVFVFDAAVAASNADIVTDFDPTQDLIELDAAVFAKLKPGALKAKAFGSGTKKPGKDKKLVYYQEKTGELFYDANGKKQKGKGDVLIATLDDGLDLTKADLIVA